jgi:hypothetical protein
MLPRDRRPIVLSHDAALDTLAIELYRSTDADRREALNRKIAATQVSATRAIEPHTIAPGDLRREWHSNGSIAADAARPAH